MIREKKEEKVMVKSECKVMKEKIGRNIRM